ncbi:phosphotransferase family protein [Nocardioides dilutus]
MDFSSLVPLEGGWSGHTFVAETAGERSVVRVYPPGTRGGVGPQVDGAVLRLVRGLVPVPTVLEVRPQDGAGQPGLLVTGWVPGVRGDQLLPSLDEGGLRRVGAALGALLADLGGMPMVRPGAFVDAELRIEPWTLDLPAYVAGLEPRLGHLSVDELDGLREVALEAQTLLDTVDRACLVHSDLNPKNLLLDPGSLDVVAVLDWEYAHAGHPFTDLGNLLRFDRHPAYVAAVLEAYAARRGTPPDRALSLARAADLFALVELSTRRAENPVAARANRLLRAIARSRDVGAPGPAEGVQPLEERVQPAAHGESEAPGTETGQPRD